MQVIRLYRGEARVCRSCGKCQLEMGIVHVSSGGTGAERECPKWGRWPRSDRHVAGALEGDKTSPVNRCLGLKLCSRTTGHQYHAGFETSIIVTPFYEGSHERLSRQGLLLDGFSKCLELPSEEVFENGCALFPKSTKSA